jgi:hypothetical protein
MSVGLFKFSDENRFKCVLQAAVEAKGGLVFWSRNDELLGDNFAFASTQTVQAVFMEDWCYPVLAEIGARFAVPWINLFFQENAFWEYNLRLGDLLLDSFSVAPQELDNDPAEIVAWGGRPEVLASTWAVPVQRINRYMVNWRPGTAWSEEHQREVFGYWRKGKAYPDDEYEYGDIWQAVDFIHALGGEYPYNGTAGRVRPPPSGCWRQFAATGS